MRPGGWVADRWRYRVAQRTRAAELAVVVADQDGGDVLLVERDWLSDGQYVYVTGSGLLDIPVGSHRLVLEVTGEPRLSRHRVGPFTVTVYENNFAKAEPGP